MMSLNESTYSILKKSIMTFELEPGTVLSAQKVASELGVSRTPAREAIVKLEKEGLLNIIPKSGSIVSKINMKRANQEWFVRKSLEVGMVDDFFANYTEEVLQEMEKAICVIEEVRKKSTMPCVDLDNAFHSIVYECSGQFLAEEIINTQMSAYDRLRYLSEKTFNVERESTVNEHRRLLQMARGRDIKGYKKEIEEHLYRIGSYQNELQRMYPQYFDEEN